MMNISKNSINSFVGNIVTLKAESGENKVTYFVEDDSVARIRELGMGKYLVVLCGIGSTKIKVTDGKEYAECAVSVREAKKSDPDGKFNIYVGDLHSHTCYSDGLEFTPYQVLEKVRDEHYFDFYTISDHASLEDNDEFFNTFEAAEMYESDDFVIFPGCESEVDVLVDNRMGYTQNNGGEIVTINTEGYTHAKSWEQFFTELGSNATGFASIAHPQILGFGIKSLWNSFDLEHSTCARTRDLIRCVEVINSYCESNLVNERVYALALDAGYKVAPVGSSDHHGPRWGKDAERVRTFVYSSGKSKELFIDALRNARTYCCENGNVKMYYTVNGKNSATVLDLTNKYEFDIHAEPFYNDIEDDRTVLAEIVSDYGEIIAAREVVKCERDFKMTVESDTARYFYVRLTSKIGERTWSAPVWTGRVFDEFPKPEFTKTAINDDQFRIAYCSGGTNVEAVLNTEKTDFYISDKTNAEIVIDMGSEREISAIGYYPNDVERMKYETFARFMSRYEYLTSADGVNYEFAASGTVRLYGSETVAEFEPRKARYIKFKALTSVGSEMRKAQFKNVNVAVGAVRVY